MADGDTLPKYKVAVVEAVILEVAAELHPRRMTALELSLEVVGDADDQREVDTAVQAIGNLREFGLVCVREDDVVVPTPAALRAVALLAG